MASGAASFAGSFGERMPSRVILDEIDPAGSAWGLRRPTRVTVSGSAFAAASLARWALGATPRRRGTGEGEREASGDYARKRLHASPV